MFGTQITVGPPGYGAAYGYERALSAPAAATDERPAPGQPQPASRERAAAASFAPPADADAQLPEPPDALLQAWSRRPEGARLDELRDAWRAVARVLDNPDRSGAPGEHLTLWLYLTHADLPNLRPRAERLVAMPETFMLIAASLHRGTQRHGGPSLVEDVERELPERRPAVPAWVGRTLIERGLGDWVQWKVERPPTWYYHRSLADTGGADRCMDLMAIQDEARTAGRFIERRLAHCDPADRALQRELQERGDAWTRRLVAALFRSWEAGAPADWRARITPARRDALHALWPHLPTQEEAEANLLRIRQACEDAIERAASWRGAVCDVLTSAAQACGFGGYQELPTAPIPRDPSVRTRPPGDPARRP